MMDVANSCRNCGHPVDNEYCPACGQRTSTRRFDPGYLYQKLLDSLDVDRGFLWTLWQLIVRPGHAIREYIDGHRVALYNPIRLFLIMGAVANLVAIQLGFFEADNTDIPSWMVWMHSVPEYAGFAHYSGKYFSFFTLTGTALFACASWLLFRYTNTNFTENLVMNIYLSSGQFLIVLIFALPLTYTPEVGGLYGGVNVGYNIWILTTFFKVKKLKGVILSIVASTVPLFISFWMNYLLYRLSPEYFWTFLDYVLGS